MPTRYQLNKTQRIALFTEIKKVHETAQTFVDEWISYAPDRAVNRARLSEAVASFEHTMNLIGLDDDGYRKLVSEFYTPGYDTYEVAKEMLLRLHL